jgi:VIT1/CCC1 family predicted Fe2+/Mn2+ transporter
VSGSCTQRYEKTAKDLTMEKIGIRPDNGEEKLRSLGPEIELPCLSSSSSKSSGSSSILAVVVVVVAAAVVPAAVLVVVVAVVAATVLVIVVAAADCLYLFMVSWVPN